jgi:hypothetical protein
VRLPAENGLQLSKHLFTLSRQFIIFYSLAKSLCAAFNNNETMGALKHIVLHLCTIAHLFAIGVIFQGKEFMATMLDWPRDTVTLTPIEQHLLGAGFTFHVVLTVNDIAAIAVENAHYRAMATILEFL